MANNAMYYMKLNNFHKSYAKHTNIILKPSLSIENVPKQLPTPSTKKKGKNLKLGHINKKKN